MDKTKFYIDLSKCTEEEQIKAIALLPDKLEHNQYEILESHYKLYFDSVNWWVLNDVQALSKTELLYPEFIKLFEGGESKEVLQIDITNEKMERKADRFLAERKISQVSIWDNEENENYDLSCLLAEFAEIIINSNQ